MMRRILTPGASRKRKEREGFYPYKQPASAQAAANSSIALRAGNPDPVCSNRILAGYMAFEFLTKGTLFGEKYDPGRAEAVPLVGSSSSAEPKRTKAGAEPSMKKEHKSYGEVASILKSDGAHIPGIVNPTQLARWIQM